jgi:hypothetical protein
MKQDDAWSPVWIKQLGLAMNSSNVATSPREAALLAASAIKQALLVLSTCEI